MFQNLKYLFVFLLVVFTFSCGENLPEDLQLTRDNLNKKSEQLIQLEERAQTDLDYQELINQYIKLREDGIKYTEEANSRGFKIDNDEAFEFYEEKIKELKSNNRSSFPNIGEKIIADVYESYENGLKTYLKFESSEGCAGMCGSLTLSNNASSCKYVYTYNVNGNTIKANFYSSDCGASSSNRTFTFNESSNTISCYINGQKFVFKSIF